MSTLDLARLVKPLEWEAHQSKEEGGRSHYGTGVCGHWYNVSRIKNGAWHTVHHLAGKPTFLTIQPTMEAAQAAANADHAARVIAALDADLLAELVGALVLADQSSRDLGWHRIYDATGPVLAKLGVQP